MIFHCNFFEFFLFILLVKQFSYCCNVSLKFQFSFRRSKYQRYLWILNNLLTWNCIENQFEEFSFRWSKLWKFVFECKIDMPIETEKSVCFIQWCVPLLNKMFNFYFQLNHQKFSLRWNLKQQKYLLMSIEMSHISWLLSTNICYLYLPLPTGMFC